MPRETAGNTAGAGIKLATVPRDWNLIAENPAVAVIASRPREIYTYRISLCYVTEERRIQLSADSVDSLLFLHSAFDDKF